MKRLIFLLGSFLLLLHVGQAQIPATYKLVFSGDTATASSPGICYAPTSSGIKSSWARMFYTASEIGGTVIDTISWKTSQTGPTRTVDGQKIYLKIFPQSATPNNVITDIYSTAYRDPVAEGATLVYDGSIPPITGSGWFHCKLDTLFAVPPGYGLVIYYIHNTTSTSSTYWLMDKTTTYTQCNSGTIAASSSYKNRPITRFGGLQYDGPILDSARKIFYSDLSVAINACNSAGTTYSPYKLLVFDSATIGVTGTINKNIEISAFSSITHAERVITRTGNNGFMKVQGASAKLYLTDIVFEGDSANYKATAPLIAVGTASIASSLIMNKCIVKNCKGNGPGVGLYVYAKGTATLNDVTITSAIGPLVNNDGGAIYNKGTLTCNGNTTIAYSTARLGAGIKNEAGTITCTSPIRIHHNKAPYGAGLWNSGTIYFQQGATIDYNCATTDGGGITNTASGTIIVGIDAAHPADLNVSYDTSSGSFGRGGIGNTGNITVYGNTIIVGNYTSKAFAQAAGLYNSGGTITCKGETNISDNFVEKASTKEGAGITNLSAGTINFEGATTINNNSNYNGSGGGIYNYGSVINFEKEVTLNNNYSSSSGGAIYNTKGVINFKGNVTINGNSGTSGGGIYNDSLINVGTSISNPANLVMEKDGARSSGGGINNTSKGTLNCFGNLTVLCDTAKSSGGGIYNAGTITCYGNFTAEKDTAQTSGGAVYNTGTIDVRGTSNIKNNYAVSSGGGIYNTGTFTVKNNLSVLNNHTNTNGGGIFQTTGTISCVGELKIKDNSATAFGGGLVQSSSGTISCTGNMEIKGNSATAYGGGIVQTATGTISCTGNMTIKGNSATTYGGGLVKTGAGPFSYGTLTVDSNTAVQYGGGIYTTNALTFNGAVITRNKVTTTATTNFFGGAGIFVNGGTITFSGVSSTIGGSVANGNISSKDGGGIFVRSGTVNFNVTPNISYNTAADTGGGIFVCASGIVNFNAATTINNNVAYCGGGIGVQKKGTIVSNAVLTIRDNDCSNVRTGSALDSLGSKGGGILADAGGTITCNEKLYVINNRCYNEGGGISLWKTIVTPATTLNLYKGAEITNNRGHYGGGIYMGPATINVGKSGDAQNLIIDTNVSDRYAGGFYNNYVEGSVIVWGDIYVRNNICNDSNAGGVAIRRGKFDCKGNMTVSGNTLNGGGHGGGIYKETTTFSVGGTLTVTNNNATIGNGGGIYLTNAGSLNLTGAIITKNNSTAGGGIYVESGTLTFSGAASTIGGSSANKNTAIDGAGMYVAGGTMNFTTAPNISYNVATSNGGGIALAGGTLNVPVLTALTNNQAANGGGVFVNGGTLTATGTDI